MDVTTQVTVNRETAELMLGATRAWKTLAADMPGLFADGEALRLAGAELLLVAAVDRINYLESRHENVKQTFRHRLAANLAFPNASPKAW